MRHFIVSVPKNPDSAIDQAARDQVANTIEASIHPQRFTGIEEAPAQPPKLAPDLDAVAASMQRLHEKLGIASPDDIEPVSLPPDYGAWFQFIEHGSAPRSEENWSEALIAVFGYFKQTAKGMAITIWLLAALILGASAVKASIQIWEWLN